MPHIKRIRPTNNLFSPPVAFLRRLLPPKKSAHAGCKNVGASYLRRENRKAEQSPRNVRFGGFALVMNKSFVVCQACRYKRNELIPACETRNTKNSTRVKCYIPVAIQHSLNTFCRNNLGIQQPIHCTSFRVFFFIIEKRWRLCFPFRRSALQATHAGKETIFIS